MNVVIDVEHVTKQFKDGLVINDVSLSVNEGEIVGIVGKNGSGKTMLFKCICGFVRPTSGSIAVRGKRIGVDVDFAQDVGIIIETPGFLPYYSGFTNLRLLADINGKISNQDIEAAMELVGLKPKDKKVVYKYSLGMRQRLGLAQALMEQPSILILDEPMNGLDQDGVDEMRTLLKKLSQEGITILIASHSKEDISLLCDRVYKMDKGAMTEMDAGVA